MSILIDRGVLLIFGTFLAVSGAGPQNPVTAMLVAITAAGLCSYVTEKKYKAGLIIAFMVICIFLPELCFFLPVVLYDCVRERFHWGAACGVLYFFCVAQQACARENVLWAICAAVSIMFAWRTQRVGQLEKELIRLRDTSTELNMALRDKNKNLMEKQDYEIYLATLKERNRIAREIHDNVGHMLSRCILQVGALLTIHKESELHGQLSSVNETLNQAMTSIRESVHDLHDDSIDLKQVVLEAVEPMRQNYLVSVDYDMSTEVPRNIKYCFIMAVKEAMSNIIKHSDATKIVVILREHPAFYQLTIEDNGTTQKMKSSDGIGLINMRDRVEGLSGTFRVHTENGFKIFISIQK